MLKTSLQHVWAIIWSQNPPQISKNKNVHRTRSWQRQKSDFLSPDFWGSVNRYLETEVGTWKNLSSQFLSRVLHALFDEIRFQFARFTSHFTTLIMRSLLTKDVKVNVWLKTSTKWQLPKKDFIFKYGLYTN